MVRFKDLNYGLGQLLHKVETEEDFVEYQYIINALKPNVVKESIKEGYFSKVPNELVDDASVKKVYHEKLVKLKMLHIKTRDITNSTFFDYQGKIVRIKAIRLPMWGSSEFIAKVTSVRFDEQKREFVLMFKVFRGESLQETLPRGWGMFESEIESIEVVG